MDRLRRLPIGIVLVGALVIVSALMSRPAIRDAATYEDVGEAKLIRSAAYVVLSPPSEVLDTLTLMSVGQHIATLLTIMVLYAAWWFIMGRERRKVVDAGIALIILIAIYAAGVLMPRPMARLDKGPNIAAIDFHSHTKYSHDGRLDWTTDRLRRWHNEAGFDVAYVSDHRTFEGAREGWANNPNPVGDGTALIPAIEVVWKGEHVNVLDADRLYHGILDDPLRDIDEQALTLASSLPNNEPVLIETIPGTLENVKSAKGPGTAGVRAIELIDGAPRGLTQARRDHDRIVHLADSTNLALVAGSDHHGWGYTAPAWTLLYMPSYRAANAEQISVQVSRILRAGGRASTRVVERYVANTEGALLPLTVPLVTWGMMRTLDVDERIVWIVWLTVFFALMRVRARWRHTPQPPPHAE